MDSGLSLCPVSQALSGSLRKGLHEKALVNYVLWAHHMLDATMTDVPSIGDRHS